MSLAGRFAFQVTTKRDIRRGDDFNKSYIELKKTESVLNGWHLSWIDVIVSITKGWIFVSLLFLTYINNFPSFLSSNAKLFSGDMSLLSVVHNISVVIHYKVIFLKWQMGSTIENKFKSISYKTSSRDHFLWQNSKANHSSLMVDYNKVHLISTHKLFGFIPHEILQNLWVLDMTHFRIR